MSPQRYKPQPISLRAARAWVSEHHRTHAAPQGGLFAIAATEGGATVGVAIVGRPVARLLDDGSTAELRRLAVIQGHPNACSWLMGRCKRVARALGYQRLVTYTTHDETGASVRGAGWHHEHKTRGRRGWSCTARPRPGNTSTQHRNRWGVYL